MLPLNVLAHSLESKACSYSATKLCLHPAELGSDSIKNPVYSKLAQESYFFKTRIQLRLTQGIYFIILFVSLNLE